MSQPTRDAKRFAARRAAGAALGVLAVVVSAALGAAGSGVVTSPTARDPQPPPRGAEGGSLTTARNAACTAGHRFQSVDRALGPFCVPPDAIRAIDDPRFIAASDAGFLSESEPVIVVEIDGEARAYPIRVLVWHEIANDEVGGVPVAVTFCPLCSSPVVFDRRIDGDPLTFGVSGRLIRGNLVLFDRETESLWQQLTGAALRGAHAGRRLTLVPSRLLAFGAFREAEPQGLVMTTDTGSDEAYGEDPYAGYGADPSRPSSFQFGSDADPRLPPKARVLGVLAGGEAAAVHLPQGSSPEAMRLVRRIEVGGQEIVVLQEFGAGLTATAGTFRGATPGWSAAAFLPRTEGGQGVALEPSTRGFRDRRSGSTFSQAGRGISGALAGETLAPAVGLDSFWFAWSYFYPDTAVIGA